MKKKMYVKHFNASIWKMHLMYAKCVTTTKLRDSFLKKKEEEPAT